MLGFIVGDMVVSPFFYAICEFVLPLLLWLAIFGPIIYLVYWVVSRFYFLVSFCFNFIFGSFFTLDDVADKLLMIWNIPVDGFLYSASIGWDVFSSIMKFLFYIVSTY